MASEVFTPPSRALDSNADPYSGAKWFFYQSGTTTPQAVYTTSALSVAHSHPVVADSGGKIANIIFDSTLTYRGVCKNASESVTLHDIDPVNTDTLTQIAGQDGASLVGYSLGVTGASTRDVQEVLREFPMITDFTGVAADGTNQSTDIISALTGAYNTGDRVTMGIPANVKWHPMTVMAGIQDLDRTVLIDFGGRNAADVGAENTKILGLFAVDPDATEDTYWGSTSGHHAVFLLNNLGTSASTSADIGRMSLLFARGYFSDDDQQFKGALIQQYRRSEVDTTIWEHVWSSLNPWAVLADGVTYTRWVANTAYALNVYVVTPAGTVLKCTTAGTSGATAPVITIGSSGADGTVAWLAVDSNDRQVFSFDQLGRVKSNGANVITDLVAFKQAVTDSATVAVVRVSPTGINRKTRLYLESTDALGDEYSAPYIQGGDGFLEFRDEVNGLAAIMEGENLGWKMQMQRNAWATATDADTTPTVANSSTLYLANTGATSITDFDNGTEGQILEVIATNANTTLVHSANLTLTGSTNIAMTAYSSVTFRRVPTSISARWVEIARSIK